MSNKPVSPVSPVPDDDHYPPPREPPVPGVTQTLRGMVSLWPVVGPIVIAMLMLWAASARHEMAIDQLRADVSKAAPADAVSDLRDAVRELQRGNVEMQRMLERVCTRVACDRAGE